MLISDPNKINEFYQALVNKDETYVGSFFVGVKSTGICCIANCRARKPLLKNVNFYTTLKDTLDAGFRPCKICKPTENVHQTPELVQKAINMVKQSPKEKIKDWQLKEQGISPEMVRRWFNKHYGLTFQAFARSYRINIAMQELENGDQTIDQAYDSGYQSLSGFTYTYKKLMGGSPKNVNQCILIKRITTPIGPMFICATERGICLLEFVDRRMLESEFEDIQKRLKQKIISGSNQHIEQTERELAEYFNGTRQNFTVALDTPGTEFQNQVWQALTNIKYGQTKTYQQQAELINNPKAVRAVGTANGMNRIAIIIPCHRVIGKDGTLTGYGGGLERKRWLLQHEQALTS